jgi:hypothetical protein
MDGIGDLMVQLPTQQMPNTQREDSELNYCEVFAERADRSSKCPPDPPKTKDLTLEEKAEEEALYGVYHHAR